MDLKTDLIPYSETPLSDYFDDAAAMDRVLAAIKKAALSQAADASTEDGRKSIKSLAHKVARSKTALDDAGKEMADAARVKYDAINASRKAARDQLDDLKATVRKPVDDWENAEKDRVAAIGARLSDIENLALDRADGSGLIGQTLARAEAIAIDNTWQEFEDEAAEKKAALLAGLHREYEAAKADEDQKEELARLRTAQAEREAAEAEAAREAAIAAREKAAAENARKQAEIEAEAALEAERDKSQREMERAQREVAEAHRATEAAATAERNRIEAERKVEIAAREKREADEEHRIMTRLDVDAAIIAVSGVSPDVAQRIVTAIETGKIPHVTLNF